MEHTWVILRLPTDMLSDLRTLAKQDSVTAGQFIRNTIASKAPQRTASPDIPSMRNRESGVDALRELIEDILFTAEDWADLQEALVREGFALRAEGYALWLNAWPDDIPISKTNDFGVSYADLVRRLGPGEPPEPQNRSMDKNVPEPLRAAG